MSIEVTNKGEYLEVKYEDERIEMRLEIDPDNREDDNVVSWYVYPDVEEDPHEVYEETLWTIDEELKKRDS